MLLKFALFILRRHFDQPSHFVPKHQAIAKILKDQGLGNNNAKRAEAAEAIIRSFTGQAQLPVQANRPAKPE